MTDLCRTSEVTLITPDGDEVAEETTLLHEHELNIIVNEHPVMRLVCTAQHLEELVLGRLLTGGFIECAEDVCKIVFCKYKTEASVFLNKEIELQAALHEEKSCCTGNKILYAVNSIKDYPQLPKADYKCEWIFALAEQFAKGTVLHDLTCCTHSCMLARGGEILFTCEDIGRHNAMDKAIGYGLQNGISLSECILYTSGRVPVDMVEKAIAAGVPILASKAVPTVEAVELAEKYGLTLIGNARPDGMKLYCGE